MRKTNKRFLKNLYPDFYSWLQQGESLEAGFNSFADKLLDFIFKYILTSKENCLDIANRFYSVTAKCNDLKFDNSGQVYAYIILHFLERYHRFQLIYILLIKLGFFPLNSYKAANIIDIGTGPAQALFSLNDIYKLMMEYGKEKNIDKLTHLNYKFDYCEKSMEFRQWLHSFVEHNMDYSKIPFHHGSFKDFCNIDFKTYSFSFWSEQPLTHKHKYNMIIFSNFLTETTQINNFKNEIIKAYNTLKNGGSLIIIGSSDKNYEEIYNDCDEILVKANDIIKKNMEYSSNDIFKIKQKEFYSKIIDKLHSFDIESNISKENKKIIEKLISSEKDSKWKVCIYIKQYNPNKSKVKK